MNFKRVETLKRLETSDREEEKEFVGEKKEKEKNIGKDTKEFKKKRD